MPSSQPTAFAQATELELRSVLVATDFGTASEKATRYGAAIARRYGSRFYLMHVVSSLGFTMAGPDCWAAAGELALQDARREEQKLAKNGTFRGLHHQFIIAEGEIWQQLESAVRQYKIEMLVVGTHSRHGLGKLLLGSVAEQIFRHASCPVLTVGPNSPLPAESVISDTLRPVVFATDFSRESLAALPYAISYANRRNTRLVMLHVIPPLALASGDRRVSVQDFQEREKAAIEIARSRLNALIADIKLSVEPMCVALAGSPVECIVQTSQHLQAVGIVLGLKPHGSAISHLPWSTAYEITCQAASPVLTVRTDPVQHSSG